jgi:hypothetical protein
LKPGLARSEPFSAEEEMKLSELLDTFGTSWTKICEFLPGRSENQLKNYINSTVRRNIRRFNKFRGHDEKIQNYSLKLLDCPEIKKILMTSKNVKCEYFKDLEVSENAFEFIRSVSENFEEENELVSELDRILIELLEKSK